MQENNCIVGTKITKHRPPALRNANYNLQVLVAKGLGKYCDSEFVGQAVRQMQESLDMTLEEMNIAAREVLAMEQGTGHFNVNTFNELSRKQARDPSPSRNVADIKTSHLSGK